MTTFKDLQNTVLNTLHGHTADLEQRCALTAPVAAGDLVLTVDDATQVTRGLIEIDSELIWVKTVDQTNNLVNVSAFGRGYGETPAASHTTGAMVVNAPRFPRQYAKDALTECLSQVYPELYVVKTDESNTSVATQMTYPLPADCDGVLSVQWQSIGPSKSWQSVRRWKFNPLSDATAFPTGKSLDIFEAMVPGRTIKVTYTAAPSALVNDTDTLTSTGLGEGVRDILQYGACARLLQSLEASRLQVSSVAQGERDQVVPAGAATAASRAYWQLYTARVQDERNRLQQLYPTTSHLTR